DHRGRVHEEPLAELLDPLVHGRDDAREDEARDGGLRHAPVREQAAKEDTVLVHGPRLIGAEPPVYRKPVAVVDAEERVRVVDVDDEQHQRPYPCRTVTSPARIRTTFPPRRRTRSAPSVSTPSTRPATSPSRPSTRTSAPVRLEWASHSARMLAKPPRTKRP